MVPTLCTVWKDSVNNKAKQRYTAPRYGEKKGGEREKHTNNNKNKDKNKHVDLAIPEATHTLDFPVT